MSQNHHFFSEVFLPKEIDNKGNENFEVLKSKSSFVLLSEDPIIDWSDRFNQMSVKIAELCGFGQNEIVPIQFKNSLQINEILQLQTPQVILCFTTQEILNQLPFSRSKTGFLTINKHRIIFLPLNENFIEHKGSKNFLWKAIQDEFPSNNPS